MTPRTARPQGIALDELTVLVPHVRFAVRILRARSSWAFRHALWTDAQLTAESADALELLAVRIDGPLPEEIQP